MDGQRVPAAPEVVERLMDSYGDGILRLCYLFLRDRALAEDAAQETFVRAWQHYGTFQGQAHEKTWLSAIAVNLGRNLLRSPWHSRRVDLPAMAEPAAEDADRSDDTVVRAVLALPKKYREVVVLYYYQEWSTAEIARVLGIPQGTVTVRLKRARDRLRPCLEGWYHGT